MTQTQTAPQTPSKQRYFAATQKLSWQYEELAWRIQVAPRHYAAKLVLLMIGKAANDSGQSWHGYKSIAAYCCIDRTSVSRAITYLRDLKVLTWVEGGGGASDDTNQYRLDLENMKGLIKNQGVFSLETGKLIRPTESHAATRSNHEPSRMTQLGDPKPSRMVHKSESHGATLTTMEPPTSKTTTTTTSGGSKNPFEKSCGSSTNDPRMTSDQRDGLKPEIDSTESPATGVKPFRLCELICNHRGTKATDAQAKQLQDAADAYFLWDYQKALDWASDHKWWKKFVTVGYLSKHYAKLMEDYSASGGELTKVVDMQPMNAIQEEWYEGVKVGWRIGEFDAEGYMKSVYLPVVNEIEKTNPDWLDCSSPKPLATTPNIIENQIVRGTYKPADWKRTGTPEWLYFSQWRDDTDDNEEFNSVKKIAIQIVKDRVARNETVKAQTAAV